jgi:hypothetical protein
VVRASPLKNDYSGGEFAPVAESRVDFQRYPAGCRILENFLPLVVGAAVRRPGASFIASTRYPDKIALLLPFQYSTEQAYVLEFGDLYIRFYRNDGPLLEAAKTITGATRANPVVLTINAHGYANGDDIEVRRRRHDAARTVDGSGSRTRRPTRSSSPTCTASISTAPGTPPTRPAVRPIGSIR